MATILVTGAGGLVGSAVCRHLRAAGRPFTAVDLRAARVDGVDVAAVDVRDVHGLHALADTCGPFDSIVHCGALSGPMLARDNPILLYEVNVTGTVNLLEVARLKRVRRVVCCSSVSAYGPTPAGLDPVPETVPLRPSTVYGATKAAGEAIAHGYAAQHGVDAVSLRLGWVYGPRRTTDCDIRDMILAGHRGEPFGRRHGGATLRQYVHVDDVARALVLAADAPTVAGRAYTVTGGDCLPLPDIADIVRSAVPGLRATFGPGRDPDEDVQARFDISAAEAFGFHPTIALADGIVRYAQWLLHPSA